MINASRRGFQAGGEDAREQLRLASLPDGDVQAIARLKYVLWKQAGYAHIDPEQEFVDGFVTGVRQFFVLACQAKISS